MKKSGWKSEWIAIAGLFITTLGSTWHLAYKIGVMNEKIEALPTRTEFADMQVKLDILWRTVILKEIPPFQLKPDDLKKLKSSGVGGFINSRYPEILLTIKKMKPYNPNEARELVISVVGNYKRADEFRAIREKNLLDIDSLLLLAAMSIKDKVIDDLGFTTSKQDVSLSP